MASDPTSERLMPIGRRRVLLGLAGFLSVAAKSASVLARHGLVATELARWRVPEANQAVAVDADHFYGIGNRVLMKHRKDTGKRIVEWTGRRGGPIVHFNSGWVDGEHLVLAHSNYPQLPPVSTLETHDARTLRSLASRSLGMRHGSLSWAVRRNRQWWACFAFYNGTGSLPGYDQRETWFGQFDDDWQLLRSWHFPPEVIATWGRYSCSGGDWGDDGMLYTTGHDAAELHVLKLPRQGGTLEHVTSIDVPFAGQGWAWDRHAAGGRVIYGISRARRQVIAARIPPLPAALLI